MKTHVDHKALEEAGWDHYASDWYYYSSEGRTTHIHAGGSNKGGALELTFLSVKLNDQFFGKIYNGDTGLTDWGLLEGPKIKATTAIEFRKALKPFM